jgi:hypothetical protein
VEDYLGGILAEAIVWKPAQWRLARLSTFDDLSDSDGFTWEDFMILSGEMPMQVVAAKIC